MGVHIFKFVRISKFLKYETLYIPHVTDYLIIFFGIDSENFIIWFYYE